MSNMVNMLHVNMKAIQTLDTCYKFTYIPSIKCIWNRSRKCTEMGAEYKKKILKSIGIFMMDSEFFEAITGMRRRLVSVQKITRFY